MPNVLVRTIPQSMPTVKLYVKSLGGPFFWATVLGAFSVTHFLFV